jgi:hypothetical protein
MASSNFQISVGMKAPPDFLHSHTFFVLVEEFDQKLDWSRHLAHSQGRLPPSRANFGRGFVTLPSASGGEVSTAAAGFTA